MLSLFKSAFIVMALNGLLVDSACSFQTPLRVLALGDSITAGGFNSLGTWKVGPGYRWDLFQMQSWICAPLEFVGRLTDGPNAPTQHHEGHSGKRVDEIHEIIRGQVAKLRPDVILLMAGANDIIQDHSLSTLPARLISLVRQLEIEAPHAHLLIGIPTPTNNAIYNQRIKKLEAALLTLRASAAYERGSPSATRQSKPSKKILNFFRKAKISPYDLTDGIHMAPSGNKKLADHWAKGLRCVLKNLDCEFL